MTILLLLAPHDGSHILFADASINPLPRLALVDPLTAEQAASLTIWIGGVTHVVPAEEAVVAPPAGAMIKSKNTSRYTLRYLAEYTTESPPSTTVRPVKDGTHPLLIKRNDENHLSHADESRESRFGALLENVM